MEAKPLIEPSALRRCPQCNDPKPHLVQSPSGDRIFVRCFCGAVMAEGANVYEIIHRWNKATRKVAP
jgi:hypothetical protein